MYKKLPIFITTALTTLILFVNVPKVSAYYSRFSLQQLILKEIQQMQQHVTSQISQVSITASLISPTATPTQVPTTTPAPTATNQPVTSGVTLSDVQTYIMNGINSYRSSQGLYAVTPSSETCNFAQIRAKEIASGFNHDGFTNRVNNHTLPYKSWTRVTENIAETTNYQEVVTLWANSPGHAANMRADTPYVCVAQYQDFYAYEGVKP